MKTIVLVSPGHLGTNPRLVKEADALEEAGYRVHVISCDYFPDVRKWDEEIRRNSNWLWTCVPWRPNAPAYLFRRVRQMFARQMFSAGLRTLPVSSAAHHLITPALKKTARAISADLYIGHCLAALPAVIAAGKQNRARVAFDAEDFHSGEAAEIGGGRLDNAIAQMLEKKLLKRCDYLTASSPLTAEAYRERYGVNTVPVLNVFPLSQAVKPQPPPVIPSFYWFSQTIGPGRGLEAMIEILRQLNRPLKLDLRGHARESYCRILQRLVHGTAMELRFLSADTPGTMACHAVGYTAGLAVETSFSLNNSLALSNKIFIYLLAGVPVILSRTPAQENFSKDLGKACLLIDLKNPGDSARQLAHWLGNADVQSQARTESSRLGRERFNWDYEKNIFLAQVEKVLSSPDHGQQAR